MPSKNTDKKVTVKQLLGLIPDKELSRLAGQTCVDHWAKVLYGKSMFYLLLFGLAECEKASLRSLEDIFNSRRFKFLFNLDPNQTVRHSSISDRLATMELSFFEESYRLIYSLFRTHFSDQDAQLYNIVRVDSTMVAETANKLEKGMSVGCKKDGKKQVKYTVCLEDILPCSMEVFTAQSELSEDLTIPVTILKLVDTRIDNVFVFDRGVGSRKAYVDIHQKGYRFVTRLKESVKYEIIEDLNNIKGQQIGNLSVESDEWVYLFKGKRIDTPFRLLKMRNEQSKLLVFMSNLKDIPAEDIIMIYKKRWDIEVFFRFIKQELNFSHFMSTNINGIKIILYMTMILAMLVHIYKKINNVGFKTAKRRIKIELDDLLTILIVQTCGGDPNIVFNDF